MMHETSNVSHERRWRVYDADELILEVSDIPGPLISTAAPPPGGKPATYPFLSATAFSARHESRLREILERSSSLDGFLHDLRAAGFRIERLAE